MNKEASMVGHLLITPNAKQLQKTGVSFRLQVYYTS